MPDLTVKRGQTQTRALADNSSYNDADATLDVTFGTDEPVRMWGFYEILSFEKGHVRMGRLNAGAPVLDNHNRYDGAKNGVLGKVSKGWLETGKGAATLQLSKRDSLAEFRQDVKDGIHTNISVGYRVYKYEELERGEDDIPVYRAIDWEPTEISFAPVPADYTAQVRSGERTKEEYEVDLIRKQNTHTTNMTPEEKLEQERAAAATATAATTVVAPAAPVAPAAATVDLTAERAAAAGLERKRTAEIMEACRTSKMTSEFQEKLISDGTTTDEARKLIIAEYAKQDTGTNTRSQITLGADREVEHTREAITDSLIIRASITDKDITPERKAAAAKYRSLSLLDIAKDSLRKLGVNTDGMSKMEIVGRAITTSGSDLPVLLEGTNRRTLLANYNAIADTWMQLATVGSVSDFREYKRLRMGSLTNLDDLGENREFKTKKITDADYEKVSIATKGNMINVSREMIINDDLNAITRYAAMLGRASARTIETGFYSLLTSNGGNGPIMADGNPLFHASHNNIATTAAAPTVTSFDAARQQMAMQKDRDNNDFIGISPSIWLGPVSLTGAAKLVNNSTFDPSVSNKFQMTNIAYGTFNTLVESPRLSGTAWYAFASLIEEPVFEVNFLDGNQTPYMESKEGWNVDGVEWKIRHDWGVSAIGWRGALKNIGA